MVRVYQYGVVVQTPDRYSPVQVVGVQTVSSGLPWIAQTDMSHTYSSERRTNRQTNRQTDIQTDRQTQKVGNWNRHMINLDVAKSRMKLTAGIRPS